MWIDVLRHQWTHIQIGDLLVTGLISRGFVGFLSSLWLGFEVLHKKNIKKPSIDSWLINDGILLIHGLWNNPHITGARISSPTNPLNNKQAGTHKKKNHLPPPHSHLMMSQDDFNLGKPHCKKRWYATSDHISMYIYKHSVLFHDLITIQQLKEYVYRINSKVTSYV